MRPAVATMLLGSLATAGAQNQRSASAAPPRMSVRTIESAGAVTATVKQGPHCKAYAPADWVVSGGRDAGDAFDLKSGDGRMYAGWGIRGVNRAMQPYYGAMYGDPETSSLALVGVVLQAMGSRDIPRYSSGTRTLGAGFAARTFASSSHKGVVVYRVYPAPPGFAPGSYIISLRIAAADRQRWDADGQRIAAGVAASIACTTMLTARTISPDELPRPGDPPGMRRGRAGDEASELEDYNPQLGTQWVHSSSTGEKFLVDATAAWNENGPDGPGYYRKAGNSYEKLATGFGK